MNKVFSGLTRKEREIFKSLNTPAKIQDFLERIPINFSDKTCMSPLQVLKERKAHCLEGALFAAAALTYHGQPPLLFDLATAPKDIYHVVALFKRNGCWGAISKTNHAVLRYREPVYKTLRELALSYFHEYFLDNGVKTLRGYSEPLDLRQFNKRDWITSEKELWYIDKALDKIKHHRIAGKAVTAFLRRADKIEIKAGKLVQWRR